MTDDKLPPIPAETNIITDTEAQGTIAREFHNILKDIESLMKEASSLGGDEFAQVRDKIIERLAAAKVELAGLGVNVAGTIREKTEDAQGVIREDPWKAVGSAAAVGMLIGYLFARR